MRNALKVLSVFLLFEVGYSFAFAVVGVRLFNDLAPPWPVFYWTYFFLIVIICPITSTYRFFVKRSKRADI